MEFTASNGGAGGSYEKPKPGKYLGVLIGIADIGTQPGGQFGPKRKLMLRWELHKRKGPSLDSAGHIHTITARYNQSMDAKSSLRPVVEAHIGKLKDDDRTRTQDWLGKAAILDLAEDDSGKYVNVDNVTPLDPEEDVAPTQHEPSEHWEPRDGTPPPHWAKYAVEKSAEWQKIHGDGNGAPVGAGVGADDDSSDIPF